MCINSDVFVMTKVLLVSHGNDSHVPTHVLICEFKLTSNSKMGQGTRLELTSKYDYEIIGLLEKWRCFFHNIYCGGIWFWQNAKKRRHCPCLEQGRGEIEL